jgi:penicillin-binding protein 1A
VLSITGDGLKLAASALSDKAKPATAIRSGAVIRVMQKDKKGWAISQVPKVAAAFVSLDATTGAYQAMVGGFDYGLQKFNHVTQAWRQPGSAFKPFIYSAAVAKGFGPATVIADEPLEMPGGANGEPWTPQNDDFVFDGQVSMRRSLAASKNVPSVRLLRAAGLDDTHTFLGRFGFDMQRHPKNYTIALGTGAVTPLQLAGAYAVFANGGYKVTPYLIARVTDAKGVSIMNVETPPAATSGERVLDERNVFIMDSMMRDVARSGTGAAAGRLGRPDLAGKTGTTSDSVDGWFAGYGGGIVAVAWMGYDEPKSLGGREFGATLSLPIWMDYMRAALPKHPPLERPVPEGVVQLNGDWMLEEYAGDPTVRAVDLDREPDDSEDAAPADGAQPPQPPAPPAAPPAAQQQAAAN